MTIYQKAVAHLQAEGFKTATCLDEEESVYINVFNDDLSYAIEVKLHTEEVRNLAKEYDHNQELQS